MKTSTCRDEISIPISYAILPIFNAKVMFACLTYIQIVNSNVIVNAVVRKEGARVFPNETKVVCIMNSSNCLLLVISMSDVNCLVHERRYAVSSIQSVAHLDVYEG